MKCSNCGHDVNENDQYCESCGNKIKIHEEEINDKPTASIRKCESCGFGIDENDKFCQNCGSKVTNDKKLEEKNVNLNKNSSNEVEKIENEQEVEVPKSKKKRNLMILGIFVILVIVSVFLWKTLSQPKDIKIEASELASLILEEKEEQYFSDNLFVHGYLVRDTRKTNNEDDEYYILVSDMNDVNDEDKILIFNYDKGLEDSLGTGSEITIQGKIKTDKEGYSMGLLTVSKVEVHKKVEPIKEFESTTELISQSDKYLNKNVAVTGQLVITNMSGTYITDEKIVDSIWLYGISSSELFDVQQRGEWCIVKGKLILDGSNLAIEVDTVEQNDFTDELSINYENISLDYLNSHFNQLMNKNISVIGKLGMSDIEVENGRYAPVLHNEDLSKFIELEGKKPNIGNCLAVVYGRLEQRDNNLVLVADSYELLEQYSAGQ